METNETPETLEDDFFATHVSDRVNDTDAVEAERDKMALSSFNVKVVASKWSSVFVFRLVGVENQWISGLDVIEQDISRKDTTLTLWQVEAWELLFHAFLLGVGVVNVEHASGQS